MSSSPRFSPAAGAGADIFSPRPEYQAGVTVPLLDRIGALRSPGGALRSPGVKSPISVSPSAFFGQPFSPCGSNKRSSVGPSAEYPISLRMRVPSLPRDAEALQMRTGCVVPGAPALRPVDAPDQNVPVMTLDDMLSESDCESGEEPWTCVLSSHGRRDESVGSVELADPVHHTSPAGSTPPDSATPAWWDTEIAQGRPRTAPLPVPGSTSRRSPVRVKVVVPTVLPLRKRVSRVAGDKENEGGRRVNFSAGKMPQEALQWQFDAQRPHLGVVAVVATEGGGEAGWSSITSTALLPAHAVRL